MTAKRSTFMLVLALFAGVAALGQSVLYVDQNNPEPPVPYEGFTNWETAATNIQDAVSVALPNATIRVRPGIYTAPPGSNRVVYISDKPLRLVAEAGPAQTIIDGEESHGGVQWRYALSTTTDEFLLDGFTIRNCVAATGAGVTYGPSGARNWTAEIRNCIITNNLATSYGGGVNVFNSDRGISLVVTNTTISLNKVSGTSGDIGGAGIQFRTSQGIYRGTLTVTHSYITDNEATEVDGGGGGIYLRRGELRVINSEISRNRVMTGGWGTGGGGIHWRDGGNNSEGRIRNTVIADNEAHMGAALFINNNNKRLTLENCTLVNNVGSMIWDGKPREHLVRFNSPGSDQEYHVENSILYHNSSDDIDLLGGGRSSFLHNCTPRADLNDFGSGNITNAPLFRGLTDGDYRLSQHSPCINQGTNRPAWMATARCLEGNPRIDRLSGQVDMGAYEYTYAGTLILVQ